MGVTRCQFNQGEEKRWDDYVGQNPNAGHCHFSAWREVISKTYGHRPYYLWSCKEGKVEGILPLIFMRDLLFRRTLVSLPFLDDGGICAEDLLTAQALCEEALRLAERLGTEGVDFRHRRENGLGLRTHGKKVTLVLNLIDDPEQTWKGLKAKVRNQVRKAEKSGLSTSWHQEDGLRDFYNIFATNMRSLGSPVHSFTLFAQILKRFETSSKLILVRKGTTTVGGALCLFFKKTVFVPWASSLMAYRSLCPNNLLYWEAIRWASENGFTRFDFGRSSPGSGTYHFKKQWGASEEPLHWQFLGLDKKDPGLVEAEDVRFLLASRIWKHLPLSIANCVGPRIRGHLSQ